MCKELDLIGGKVVAVDGSFFKGNASKESIYTEANLKKQLNAIDEVISYYQEALSQQTNPMIKRARVA